MYHLNQIVLLIEWLLVALQGVVLILKGVWGQNVVNNWLKPHPSLPYTRGIFPKIVNLTSHLNHIKCSLAALFKLLIK